MPVIVFVCGSIYILGLLCLLARLFISYTDPEEFWWWKGSKKKQKTQRIINETLKGWPCVHLSFQWAFQKSQLTLKTMLTKMLIKVLGHLGHGNSKCYIVSNWTSCQFLEFKSKKQKQVQLPTMWHLRVNKNAENLPPTEDKHLLVLAS